MATLAELEAKLNTLTSSFASANLELTRRKADLDNDVIRDANIRAGMEPATGYTGDPRDATLDTVGTALIVNAPPGVTYIDKGVEPFDFWKRRGFSPASWELMSFGDHVADGIGGGTIYIRDVTATQASKNVGAKTYQDAQNTVLQSSTSDTSEVSIHVRCSYPQIKVYDPRNSGVNTTHNLAMSAAGDNFFEGVIPVVLPNAGGLIKVSVVLGDDDEGSSDSTVVVVEQAPIIQSAIFTGGYPVGIHNGGLMQTELKLNDEMAVRITADQEIHAVQFEDSGAFQAAQATPGLIGTTVEVTGKIADRGDVTQVLGARVRVQNKNGSWSNWFDTASGGNTDAEHVVSLNNMKPYIGIIDTKYAEPTSELKDIGINELQALANGDTAQIRIEFNSTNSFVVTSPQFHFNFDIGNKENPDFIETIQATAQAAVDFFSGKNISISGVRNANDALRTITHLVVLNGIPPILSQYNSPARFVSGGNDGTARQDHTVRFRTTSPLLRLTMEGDPTSDSTWEMGGRIAQNPDMSEIWSGFLRIHDDDQKGVYQFQNVVAVNWAGLMVNALADTDYTIGGFVQRSLPITGFANTTTLHTAVIDPVKLIGRYDSAAEDMVVMADKIGVVVHDGNGKVMPEYQHGSGGTTFDALASNPTTVRWLDQLQADANTTGETLTIEELA